jgi:hypothetical protein
MAGIYVVESVIHLIFSPDRDVFNGIKTAAQSIQQAVIMVIAAVTASGLLSQDAGEYMCIQLSIVQVALALPEQLWTTMKSTCLSKQGTPKDSDFKMTENELKEENLQRNTGFVVKIKAAKAVVAELRPTLQLMLNGDLVKALVAMLTNRNLIVSINSVRPGSLNTILERVSRVIFFS